MTADPWYWSAACHGTAPLFDAPPKPRTALQRAAVALRLDQARAICATCPVTRECADDAVIGRDEGIRAGVLLPPLDWNRKEAAA